MMELRRIQALPDVLFPDVPEPEPTVHEVLVKARNWLATHIWTPGWGNGETSGCAMTAICKVAEDCGMLPNGSVRGLIASNSSGITLFIMLKVERVAVALSFSNCRALISWNDYPGQNREAVLARFDRAIAKTAPEPALPAPLPTAVVSSHEFDLVAC